MSEGDAARKDAIRLRIEESGNLPTLPGVVARIMEMVDSPETTGRQLGQEIAKDQVLSAKVLKLVNSGFYGFFQPISTVSHAVTMLGFDAVRSLVLSSSVLEMMGAALPGLWEHSLACARSATMIAEHVSLPNPEEMSVIGLLHDLGKVILFQSFEDDFKKVQKTVQRQDGLFFVAEEKVMGINHGELGGWLLEKWTLPAKLVTPIVDHHDFRPRRDHADRTAVLHLADILCRAESFGNGGDAKIPRLEPQALDLLEIDMGDVRRIMDRMNAELSDIPRG
jgi:putative nucleotidyltransferase with HDIG domain